jgi:hypothetical protein
MPPPAFVAGTFRAAASASLESLVAWPTCVRAAQRFHRVLKDLVQASVPANIRLVGPKKGRLCTEAAATASLLPCLWLGRDPP